MKLKGIFGTEFQISSKTLAIIFGATGALLAALSSKAIPVPMGVPDIWADYAASWSNFLIKLWAPVGPTLLVLFSDSTPGPLAPPDPQVVQVATAKAVDMGQITKALLFVIILIFGAGAFHPAYAATVKKAVAHALPIPLPLDPLGLNGAAASATGSSVTVAPNDPLQTVLTNIFGIKQKVIDDLNQALTTQAGVINPATNAAWDPLAVMCLNGVPMQGTEGQPGYVPAQQGLIAWLTGLPAPAASAVPPLPTSPSAATLAVHARLLLIAANADVTTVVSNVNSQGIPTNLRASCGSLLQDTVTQALDVGKQGVALAGLLGKFIPAAAIAVPKIP